MTIAFVAVSRCENHMPIQYPSRSSSETRSQYSTGSSRLRADVLKQNAHRNLEYAASPSYGYSDNTTYAAPASHTYALPIRSASASRPSASSSQPRSVDHRYELPRTSVAYEERRPHRSATPGPSRRDLSNDAPRYAAQSYSKPDYYADRGASSSSHRSDSRHYRAPEPAYSSSQHYASSSHARKSNDTRRVVIADESPERYTLPPRIWTRNRDENGAKFWNDSDGNLLFKTHKDKPNYGLLTLDRKFHEDPHSISEGRDRHNRRTVDVYAEHPSHTETYLAKEPEGRSRRRRR